VRRVRPASSEALAATPTKREAVRVPFGSLVERGMLPAGSVLTDRMRRVQATVVADRLLTAFTNAIVEWPNHACAGWNVSRCDFQDNYQRLLIQSGPGTVAHCLFARQGCGIEINSDFPYVEGGVARDIAIIGNTFVDVNPQPGGVAISTHAYTYGGGVPPFANIFITANVFVRPGSSAIRLVGFSGGVIASNRFEQVSPPPIELLGCSDIREEDNRPAR